MQVIGNDLQPLSKFVSTALIKKMDIPKVKAAVKDLEKTVAPKIMKYQKTTCPSCGEEADVMYTFHVKSVRTASDCKEHLLFSNFVLALKNDIFTLVCPDCGEVYEHNFKDGPAICPSCGKKINSPREGYVDHGKFKCEKCGEEKVVSEYGNEDGYPFSTKLVAIEYYCPHCRSHGYKKIDPEDQMLYDQACIEFDNCKDELPIPDQKIPVGYNTNQILNHGYKKFSDLFNKRQLLCLGILLKAINEVNDKDVQFWLQLAFSGMLEMNNMFCRYQANAYKICNIFFNHAYVPITMPVENNVWGTKLGTGNFIKTIEKIIRGKKFCSEIYDISTCVKNGKIEVEKIFSSENVECIPATSIADLAPKHPYLHCGDSRNLDFIADKSVDMVLTDPPFGANVMYSELIDFFHVWNYKSTLAEELGFDAPLSPKSNEIIVNETRNLTQKDYSQGLEQVFAECHRVIKDNGFLIFSFHDKSLDSWRSLLESVDKAGFNLVRTYPLHSETRTGAHTSNKNSIALDIMLIYKKKTVPDVAFNIETEQKIYREALEETESVVKRLSDINAEMTIPDIQNIFLSEYFCGWSNKGYCIHDVFNNLLDSIKEATDNISNYFQDISIASKRTGWWSELYNQKWDV
jgi:adenine-specific DNA methylase